MLKAPKKTKFKSPHLYLSKKDLKEYKRNVIIIKTKESHLMTAQQREFFPTLRGILYYVKPRFSYNPEYSERQLAKQKKIYI